MICSNCNKEFENKRTTAKYCSSECRKLAFQKKGISVLADAKVSVPRVSVPGNFLGEDGKRIIGKCIWCGGAITPAEYGNDYWQTVQCCYACVKKRNNL